MAGILTQAMSLSGWFSQEEAAVKALLSWCKRPSKRATQELRKSVGLMGYHAAFAPAMTPSNGFICELAELDQLLADLQTGDKTAKTKVRRYLTERAEKGHLLKTFTVETPRELLALFQKTGML